MSITLAVIRFVPGTTVPEHGFIYSRQDLLRDDKERLLLHILRFIIKTGLDVFMMFDVMPGLLIN